MAGVGARTQRTAGQEDVVGACASDVEQEAAGPLHTEAGWAANLVPGAA